LTTFSNFKEEKRRKGSRVFELTFFNVQKIFSVFSLLKENIFLLEPLMLCEKHFHFIYEKLKLFPFFYLKQTNKQTNKQISKQTNAQ
jgi:hypothetical protein